MLGGGREGCGDRRERFVSCLCVLPNYFLYSMKKWDVLLPTRLVATRRGRGLEIYLIYIILSLKYIRIKLDCKDSISRV